MLDEKQNKIISDVVDLIGVNVITEWAANASMLTSTLLRSYGDVKPADLEGQIALNYFFLEALKKKFDVDPELFDIELNKCYRQMEIIMNKSKEMISNPVETLKGVMDNMGLDLPASKEEPGEVGIVLPLDSQTHTCTVGDSSEENTAESINYEENSDYLEGDDS